MSDQSDIDQSEMAEIASAEAAMEVGPETQGMLPFPFPLFFRSSGLYKWQQPVFQPTPIPQPIPIPQPLPPPLGGAGPDEAAEGATEHASPIWWWFQREELRLDVDGRYPQNTVSGTVFSGFAMRVHWIANLTPAGFRTWTGTIWYKDGNTFALPHTRVKVTVVNSWFPHQRRATVTFTGGGAATKVRTYSWSSAYFHPVELEYDTVQGTDKVTQVDTCAHPNRPASLPCETLTIETVYRRAGFDVSKSGGDGIVPFARAGTDRLWSDAEMHDAMQVYWRRFANRAQWSMWVLFAHLHRAVPPFIPTPEDLGGIMFDDIGPNHRQGTAIFNDSFIKNPPAGDPDPVDWVKRTKFWTAVHEIGHGFNLAHSWQKSLGTPWIALANEPEARSFMNYPDRVIGRQSAFYANFEYRFSDQELLFLRHAPSRFVQMGNADWFDDHGFQQADIPPQPGLSLEARVHRQADAFEFLEPVSIELKLTNTGDEPQIVDRSVLLHSHDMLVIIKKTGKPARQWSPYATMCFGPSKQVLQPGESVYGALDISSGLNGWDIAEPGVYHCQVCLHMDDGDVVSNALRLRVAPPRSWDEEYLAQDFFTEDVGRILHFNGSAVLDAGNKCLEEVVDKLDGRRVALHARMALASPHAYDYKTLSLKEGSAAMTAVCDDEGQISEIRANPEEAKMGLGAALTENASEAVETFGHIGYNRHMSSFGSFLASAGDKKGASRCQKDLHDILAKRKVIKSVLDAISDLARDYAGTKAKPRKEEEEVAGD